jgi:hypothetical protein
MPLETPTAPWPTERGRYSGVVLQFGQARAEILRRALVTGDPLADAVAEAIHVDGRRVHTQLQDGLAHGRASLPDPHPAVAALLTHTETLPDYATDELLDEYPLPFFTMPAAAHIVSLSAGALIRVYESPSIAQVLTTTGRLIEGADRRIQETGKWVNTVMLPGGLRPGGQGYVATIQVRMLHAHMRRVARSRGFDEVAYGAPINQVDYARTWIDFTLTSLEAEEKMGLGLTSAETARIYRYWWLVAHLLGIEPELVEGIQSNEQAARADELFQAVTGPIIGEGAALAEHTLRSISGTLQEALNVPPTLGAAGLHSLARRFHPRSVADELRIRENAVADRAIGAAISRIRAYRAKLRQDPERWEEEQRKAVASTREFVEGVADPLYETHVSAGS